MTGLRSEFDGSSKDEVSTLLTPAYTSTPEKPCILLSAILSSPSIRLDFSLLPTTNDADPLPPPDVVQTTFLNESVTLQLYYIHLPVGVSVMLEIKASQSYYESWTSNVLLRRIESNSCQVIQPGKISHIHM